MRMFETGSRLDQPQPDGPGRRSSGTRLKPFRVVALAVPLIVAGLLGIAPVPATAQTPDGGTAIIDLEPERLAGQLAPGQSESQGLTIANPGMASLDWSALNQNVEVQHFFRDGALTLETDEYLLTSALIDPDGRYAYFGTSTPPGQLIKIDLETMERVDSIVMDEQGYGEDFLFSALIDPDGRYAYFGTGGYPGKVVKVDLQTFERVGAIDLWSGEDVLRAAVMDPAGDFAYFGTDTFPVHIVKIDLATFERVGAIDLDEDLDALQTAAVVDPAGQFAYFGVNFGSVVKIDLTSFMVIDVIDTGVATLLGSALIDPLGEFAYFGTYDAPGRIVKVDLAGFAVADIITMNQGEDRLGTAVIDAAGDFAYFGTLQTIPGRLVKIDLGSFERVGAVVLDEGENDLRASVIDPAGGDIYVGTFTFPGRVVKIGDRLRSCTQPDWISVNPSGGSVAAGDEQAVQVDFAAIGLVVGYHEAALCFDSNDPGRPRAVVPVELDVRLADVTPAALAFEVLRDNVDNESLTITNAGNGTLAWSITQADPIAGCGTPSTASWLAVEPATGATPSGGTAEIVVSVDAGGLVAGADDAVLCVSASSAPDVQTVEIPVGLTVLEPTPAIGVDPGNLSFSLAPDQSGMESLSIGNAGPGVLDWTILEQNTGAHLERKIVLDDADQLPRSAVVDADGEFAYFGTTASPGQVVKFDLATNTRIAALTLAEGENTLISAAIDPVGGFAYFGTRTVPGRIVKIDLATFTRVGAITLAAGEDELAASVIDPTGVFGYFGTRTDPARIVKVDLASFERVGAIVLDSSQEEAMIASAAVDPAGEFAYFGMGIYTGKVAKIDLAGFQAVDVIAVAPQGITTTTIDAAGRYAFLGASPPGGFGNGMFIRLDLASFQPDASIELDLDNNEGGVTATVIDPAGRFAYVGTAWGSAKRLLQIDLHDFARVGEIPLGVFETELHAAVVHPDGRYAYFGSRMSPGQFFPARVLQIDLGSTCVLPGWLTAATGAGSVPGKGAQNVRVDADAGGLAVGRHEANLCIASNDPIVPLTEVPVALTVQAQGDHIFANGFEAQQP